MLARGLAANYLGEVWVTLAQFAIVPVYIHFLGVEAYGMIGVHLMLTALAALSNLGVTPAFNREISRLTGVKGGEAEIRSFVRTVELVYWGISLSAVAIALLFLVPPVVRWIDSGTLGDEHVRGVIMLMFVQIALQLLVGFYSGGLLGLQKHVLLNILNVVWITIRLAGAAFVLAFVSPTLDALFLWLALATGIQVLAMALATHRVLPAGAARFNTAHLRRTWRYATGVSATVVLSLLLTQIDKVILSRTLPLAEFGLYALASTIAMVLGRPLAPVARTLLPQMTLLAAQNNQAELARSYHRGAQIASLAVIPATIVLVFFTPEFMRAIFVGSPGASAAAPIVAILSVGFCGLALMVMPYMLTLACGWVQFGFYQNLIACLFLVPATLILVNLYGMTGGASAWAILTMTYLIVSPYFLHRRLLPGELWNWYRRDVIPPAVVSLAAAFFLRQLPLFGHGWLTDAAALAVCAGIVTAAALLSLDLVRSYAVATLRRWVRFSGFSA